MECKRRLKPTTLAERVHFVWLWMDGVPSRTIAQQTGISVTTVCRWIKRWQEEGTVNTRSRRGKPLRKAEDNIANDHNMGYQAPVSSVNYVPYPGFKLK